jgi:hypothetical protein
VTADLEPVAVVAREARIGDELTVRTVRVDELFEVRDERRLEVRHARTIGWSISAVNCRRF